MVSVSSPIKLRDLYEAVLKSPQDDQLWHQYLWEGPTQSDIAKWQAQGYSVYQGKIRTVLNRDGRVQMLHSDRLTAFDCLIGYIPGKGALLTAISKWWFEQLGKEVPTHYIDAPGPRAMITEACVPFKAEIVVRGYLAGSMLKAYEKGERLFCGVKLPEGLTPYGRLPEPIITPTTKAAVFQHDENTSSEQLIANQICTKAEWDEISHLALKVFSIGSRLCDERGWLLVDAKYEFGRGINGQIKLIDEVHTPDASRFWMKNTYEDRLQTNQVPEMLDKQNLRSWLAEHNFTGYGEVPEVPRAVLVDLAKTYLYVAETVTGAPVLI